MNKWLSGTPFMSVDEYVKVLSISVETFADSEFLTVSCIAMALCSANGYSEFDRNSPDGIAGGW